MDKTTKSMATGAVAAVTATIAPPWFNWCVPSYLGGSGGPPGFICIGNTFITPWLALPIGIVIVAAAAAVIARVWS